MLDTFPATIVVNDEHRLDIECHGWSAGVPKDAGSNKRSWLSVAFSSSESWESFVARFKTVHRVQLLIPDRALPTAGQCITLEPVNNYSLTAGENFDRFRFEGQPAYATTY